MADLLFEIGCEEIPARFVESALPELDRLARARFDKAQLSCQTLETVGTPRRLVLVVRGLLDRQPDVDETLVGPPVTAGAKAAEGFAKKYGLDPKGVLEEDTDKGRRFVARRQVKGRTATEVLPELLSGLLAELPWPKSMRWGTHDQTFVRPVHWIVALHGGEVIPVELAGVRSGRKSRGHRFLAPETFDVELGSYKDELRRRFVIVDPVERRRTIEAELKRIETETTLSVRPDESLLAEVTNLVEYPVGVSGTFDERFLEVPEAVVVSAMRLHQRYFAMTSQSGRLANRFVTIAGTVVKDVSVVAHGNERVLQARLSDARFFFEEDRKVKLEDRSKKLEGIVWVRGLGTVAEKVVRLETMARWIARKVGAPEDKAARAAKLCKTDLPTHLVGEFPDLQGTIGTAYAKAEGEDAEVAEAIAGHYQPRGASDRPASGVGAVLAIADRIDSLLGCFGAGLVPTGSADPYGLRRAALGILATILEHEWHLSLFALAEESSGLYATKLPKIRDEALPQVLEFIKGRLRGLFAEEFPGDVVDAVLGASYDDPTDARHRLRAFTALRSRADFEPFGIAIKRVGNILKGVESADRFDPSLLREPAEQALAEVLAGIGRRVGPLFEAHRYDEALKVLVEFKAPVDTFFEKVFVMDKDERVRQNRLALLGSIHRLFLKVADFRQLSVG